MALPIAVLISSVMVMGNMAEKYELASMKSAGIPLFRIMLSLIMVATVIMVVSFLISNNFIPISNLKFQSRLYDIKKQKPTLSLEEGIFNYDFKGFAIRVDKKHEDRQKELEGMMIYDSTYIGYFDRQELQNEEASFDKQLLWSGGLAIETKDGKLAIFIPLINSTELKNLYDQRSGGSFWARITYAIDFNRLSPWSEQQRRQPY